MRNVKLLLCLFLMVSLSIFIACDKTIDDTPINQNPDEVSQTKQLQILLTDAPLDVEEVNIDLQQVIIFSGEEGKDSLDMNTLAGMYNLLDFQNGLTTLIADVELTADSIKQIRLVLGEGNNIVADGETHDLKIPSADKSGLKIKVNKPLTADVVNQLTIDFDAEKSVKQLGNGRYQMKPVLKVVE